MLKLIEGTRDTTRHYYTYPLRINPKNETMNLRHCLAYKNRNLKFGMVLKLGDLI
jgi:hypothetical protein